MVPLLYLVILALSISVVFGYSMFSNSKKWDPRGKVRPKLGRLRQTSTRVVALLCYRWLDGPGAFPRDSVNQERRGRFYSCSQ